MKCFQTFILTFWKNIFCYNIKFSFKKAVSIEKITNEKGKEDLKIEILVEDIESITTKKDEILIFNFIKDACEKVKIMHQNK